MEMARSAPCPCGSGLKYKRCHGSDYPPTGDEKDIAWSRLRRVIHTLPSQLLNFTAKTFGKHAIPEAWEEFLLWDEWEPLDPESEHSGLFFRWLLFTWSPDPAATRVANPALHGRTPASVWLERGGEKIPALVREYVSAACAAPLSFHEIVSVEKGRGFRLRDMFTGQERDVIERSASSNATRGDMLYGTVVSAGGVTVLDATASLLFSPDDRLAVLRFRKAHPKLAAARSDAVVADWGMELRELYFALSDRVSRPTFPELQNTDGHPIEFQTVFYDIDSAQAAFDGLRHLAVDHSAEELESDIKRSAAGEVSEALVPWLRRDDEHEGETGSHTSLGQIHIGPRDLRVEVNSVERAAIVRGIIEEALGTGARYRRSESTTVEEARHKHGPGLSSRDPHGVGPSADDSPAGGWWLAAGGPVKLWCRA